MLLETYTLIHALLVREHKYSAMDRREHVQPVRRHQSGRMGAGRCDDLSAIASTRIDRLDHSWFTNSNVDEAGCRIENSHNRTAGNRPYVVRLGGTNIDLDQRGVVARNVKATTFVVDINPMCAA